MEEKPRAVQTGSQCPVHAATAKHLAGFWRERQSKMAGKINDFVTSSGFNELFSGYNQGFQWQIGCTLGSGELRWGAPSLGMTEALSQKLDL